MQYIENFFSRNISSAKSDIFLIFAQKIKGGFTLEPPYRGVLTSTHNLSFGGKTRKIGIPLHTLVLRYKSGVQVGTHYTEMFS